MIGIRPGEKIHELMCPNETARDTIEFKNHYLITPYSFNPKERFTKYLVNRKKEKGKFVKHDFIYSSDKNSHFLSINEIKKIS